MLSVPILVYHHVLSDPAQRGEWVVPLADFRAHMAYLARDNIAVCTLDDFLSAYRARQPLREKTVVVTFDDGFAATCLNVEPVLEEHHFPATLFLTTGIVGQRDPLGSRGEGTLTWGQVCALRHFRVEAHTVSHPRLSRIRGDEMRQEIRACKSILEERLGRAIRHFAYPYGGYTRAVRAEVRDAGYESAYATHNGPATLHDDPFQFHRIIVDGRDPLDVFARRVECGCTSRWEEAAVHVRNTLFRVPGVHDLAEWRKAKAHRA